MKRNAIVDIFATMIVLALYSGAFGSRGSELTERCKSETKNVINGSIEDLICKSVGVDDTDIPTRSHCRWNISFDTKDDRIPRVLPKVECLPKPADNKTTMDCHEMIHLIPVQVEVSGSKQWDLIRIPVACVYTTKYYVWSWRTRFGRMCKWAPRLWEQTFEHITETEGSSCERKSLQKSVGSQGTTAGKETQMKWL